MEYCFEFKDLSGKNRIWFGSHVDKAQSESTGFKTESKGIDDFSIYNYTLL